MMARANRQQLRTVKLPGQARRDRRSCRARPGLQRRRRHHRGRSLRHRQPRRGGSRVCAALDHCGAQQRQLMAERLRGKGAVRLPGAPGVAGRGAARQGARRAGPPLLQGKPALLSEEGSGGARARLCRPRQRRACRARIDLRCAHPRTRRQDAPADRRPPARDVEPRGASADGGRRSRADDRRVPAVHRRSRAADRRGRERGGGGTAIILEPHTGEILALANWPTFNPNAFNASDVVARRNRAIQDLYEPGSTFKVVTASAAIEEGLIQPDRSDRLQSRATSRSAPASSATRTSTECCRSSTSLRSRAMSARSRSGMKVGPDPPRPLHQPFWFWPDACVGFPQARTPAWSGSPIAARPERARLGLDGLSGRRDAAADGGGRRHRRQRRRAGRTPRRARIHPERPSRRGAAQRRAPRDYARRRRRR